MCSCTTFTTPSAACNCFQLKPNSEHCGGGKMLFYFRRRLENLWVNNPIQLQRLFSPGALFLLGAALPRTLIKVEIRSGGMGTQQKHKLRTGDQKDKQKQKAGKGRHKESQLSVWSLGGMEERQQLLEQAGNNGLSRARV